MPPRLNHFGFPLVRKNDGGDDRSWESISCGHCGETVSAAVVASIEGTHGANIKWMQCPKCHDGSVRTLDGSVYPGALFGPSIDGLPTDVEAAYQEAQACMIVNAFTATEGMCRKLLMHVAVDKGAKEGATFASYIDHLVAEGYVTPPMKEWVKLIKDHGNEAQHRLAMPSRERAEGTVLFTAQLLRMVYEMAHLAAQFAPSDTKKS